MSRKRKKSRAAQQAKNKDLVEKSLPALPPSAIPPGAFSDERVSPDSDTPTELSPRPTRPTHPRKESSARGSPRPARSPEQPPEPPRETGLGPPAPNYRNNRNSSIFGTPADLNALGAPPNIDGDNGFFIPVALDPSPAPSVSSPRSNAETLDSRRAPPNDKDYFTKKNEVRGSQASTPHIAFQEKARRTSSDYETSTPKEPSRKPSKSSRSDKSVVSQASPHGGEDKKSRPTNGKPEDFKLQDAPKSKKSTNNNPPNHTAGPGENGVSTTTNGSPRKESPPRPRPSDQSGSPTDAWENRARDDDDRQPPDMKTTIRTGEAETSRPVPRRAVPTPTTSGSGMCTHPANATRANEYSPIVNGKPRRADDLVPPPRPQVEQKMSETYMSPRAPPPPPGPGTQQTPTSANVRDGQGEPNKISPKLPRWSSGGDFTMDEDMARILGTDEGSSNLLRRVSNAVRHGRPGSVEGSAMQGRGGHGRSMSETTRGTTSPRWPKTPIVTDHSGEAKDVNTPTSVHSPNLDDPAYLRRQLRNSEQRVAELERQRNSESDLLTINEKLAEKRKTVSVLDAQTEIVLRELEVLAGFVERSKDTNRPIDPKVLEDSAIKEFVHKLENVKQTMRSAIEQLHAEREELLEERNQAVADRDRALLEFEQLSSKNAQLADMNNDLTHQIQGRFRSHVGSDGRPNGLGIYANHKATSSTSVHNIDTSSIQTGNTMVGTDVDEPILEGPTVVQVRKGQVKKFNWKKGGKSMAQNITKVGRAVAAFQTNERDPRAGPGPQQGGLTTDNIGLPYNMTSAEMAAPSTTLTNGQTRGGPQDARSFGFFGKKQPTNMPKSISTTNISLPTAIVDASTSLFGSELVERAEFERRQIPSVVTRCIEEVELRGMDCEGIYRKSGGNSQVKMIQEGFEKMEDFDISDASIDIASVTSVLKQYFRKLPTPLLTFEVYDRILESAGTSRRERSPRSSPANHHTEIIDGEERCDHLRRTVNMLPQKHRDCLEFLMFHLARVALRERENLVWLFTPFVLVTQLLTSTIDVSKEFGCGIRTKHYARPQSRERDDRHAC